MSNRDNKPVPSSCGKAEFSIGGQFLEQKSGLIIILTGPGKGKTTAAFGQAMRAVGHGRRVLVIQFLKKIQSGEVMAAARLKGLTVRQFGTGIFCDLNNPDPREIEMARLGLETVRQALSDGRYDMIILDEINVVLHHRLIPLGEFLQLIERRPPYLDLILTGRNAPVQLIELADTVSEIAEVKHHRSVGIPARKGIEY